MQKLMAILTGIIFGLGLSISQMIDRARARVSGRGWRLGPHPDLCPGRCSWRNGYHLPFYPAPIQAALCTEILSAH